MTEIKIVFEVPEKEEDLFEAPWFKLYIDGKREENVKAFSMNITDIDIETQRPDKHFSYNIERYIDLLAEAEAKYM